MSTQTDADAALDAESARWHGSWIAGAAGGLVGALGFGLVMTALVADPVLEVAIPNMYLVEATPGDPAPLVGWALHLFHGAVIGLGFAAMLRIDAVARFASQPAGLGALAAYYGVMVWVLLAALVMPVWLQTVGFAGAPALPNISLQSLFGHVIYSGLLALVYTRLAA